ncbi:Xaa-Pro dipeptidyl-peptidase [Liquorilactobacillus oeni]|uniref:Xaa-Pro dipeptidyl-peptidase n=1 Tax=Liquorilactobacillus oeni DSM 19972 TaxID=1423777 RepID=A0A0R1MK42_9LACO|nr:Xaa-Pro dipeptidyl-peptidase [Liquorilactobacillus oeni]KRL05666.1 x-prolyl-dipeptidyl aminopeptidase [Liquorilactobacillus oeni DSM 19972]
MHNNQFARLKVPYAQKIAELRAIHYINDELLQEKNLNQVWQKLLEKAFPQARTQATKKQKAESLLATDKQNVTEFLERDELSLKAFYNVALQLLGFLPEEDFSFADPLKDMEKIGLYYANRLATRQDLLAAWYDLLCTHTKNGLLFLDELAAQGYFTSFIGSCSSPLFFNGKAQPVFDTTKLIYETVYVETDLDTDQDSALDLLKVNYIRPSETESGLKVPAIYTASPYNQGTNDQEADKLMHCMATPLLHKVPRAIDYSKIKYHAPSRKLPAHRKIKGQTLKPEESFSNEFSYTLNDYLLARGFAAVYAAGIGTKDSDGVRTCGSPAETASTIAVVEWLNGKRTAFTNKSDQIAIKAWWCNGAVAMTGKSYLGTLATAAATTGVSGLKTIISEAAISSWYDYYREGGLVAAPGGFPGEDADVLALECFSRKKQAGDYLKVKDNFSKILSQISSEQDRSSGNYNTFWDARNYLKDTKNVTADILMVHGLNDWNVKPKNVYNLWQALKNRPITQKLILHQGKHIYINNFRSLDFTDIANLWLSFKLYQVDNHADKLLPDVIVQDNLKPEKWTGYADWEKPEEKKETFWLQPHELTTVKTAVRSGAATFKDHLSPETFDHYQKNTTAWRRDLLIVENSPLKNNCLLFRTPAFSNDLLLRGTPEISVNVAVNKDHGMLSFMLVDYGNAKRLGTVPQIVARKALDRGYQWQKEDLVEFELAKTTPWKMISLGHINLQNRHNTWQNDELDPNKFYTVNLTLQPIFYHLNKGHQLGLVVYSTDFGITVRPNEDLAYSLQFGSSCLKIQVVNPELGE